MNQPAQQQEPPGRTGEMNPRPDHGEESYRGSRRLADKAAGTENAVRAGMRGERGACRRNAASQRKCAR